MISPPTPTTPSDETKRKRFVANLRTKMCWFYPRGSCDQGHSCNFAHDSEELRPRVMPRSSAVCRHWARGWCRLGEECRFAHPDDADAASETDEVTQAARSRTQYGEAGVGDGLAYASEKHRTTQCAGMTEMAGMSSATCKGKVPFRFDDDKGSSGARKMASSSPPLPFVEDAMVLMPMASAAQRIPWASQPVKVNGRGIGYTPMQFLVSEKGGALWLD
eukprot:TRINITY_DN31489_c0_g1_i2.p1 TRINITY_DN31489_c0_g1~~TRINITY_DN31489_c0_g1_i2.p1  ORF type:complete len:219 (+),score=22.81 TRINITY_DN31489_c0_g1_i2:159-815(+)